MRHESKLMARIIRKSMFAKKIVYTQYDLCYTYIVEDVLFGLTRFCDATQNCSRVYIYLQMIHSHDSDDIFQRTKIGHFRRQREVSKYVPRLYSK